MEGFTIIVIPLVDRARTKFEGGGSGDMGIGFILVSYKVACNKS